MGYILSGDYSQIELRILAHCSDDPSLKEAFMRGEDVHAVTAALLFGIDEKSVLPDQRNVAKRVNFGIMYGMSAYGLAQELSISQQQAQQFIKDYFLRYPAVQTYIERVYQQVAKQGYVSTVMGRRRYLPDFNSADQRLHEFAQRQAVNSPIQGACADLIKVAMVKIYRQLKNHNFATRCILQIHDELVFDVPQHELMQVISLVRDTMEKSMELTVPIVVQIKYGANWADMQKV